MSVPTKIVGLDGCLSKCGASMWRYRPLVPVSAIAVSKVGIGIGIG